MMLSFMGSFVSEAEATKLLPLLTLNRESYRTASRYPSSSAELRSSFLNQGQPSKVYVPLTCCQSCLSLVTDNK